MSSFDSIARRWARAQPAQVQVGPRLVFSTIQVTGEEGTGVPQSWQAAVVVVTGSLPLPGLATHPRYAGYRMVPQERASTLADVFGETNGTARQGAGS